MIAQFVHFRAKAVFLAGQIVIVTCVFMHIPGSIFVFNISRGQLRRSDLEKHIGEPPQLLQAANFHSRHER
jgi:hypothetical protein